VEVHGHAKQGASYGYTRALGYHPLLATRAGSGEVLHARLRAGRANTARGMPRFVDELVGRVRRAGASGELTIRMDSGFWAATTRKRLRHHRVRYSITVRQTKPIRQAIQRIGEQGWTPICYPDSGVAEVAETAYKGDRLIVRRVRHLTTQGQLFPTWDYHAFVTDRDGDMLEVEADHRRHAIIEQSIAELKSAGLAHFPSGRFTANAAWLALAVLAHNLARAVGLLAGGSLHRATAATLRRAIFTMPGRLVRSGRRRRLRLPENWPWAEQFTTALAAITAIPLRS
jgi:hypothetical protein